MLFKTFTAIFLTALLACTVSAQKTYSESSEYKAPKIEKPDKNKKKKGSPDSSASAPQGDVTLTIPVSILDRKANAVSGIRREEISVFVDDVEVPISSFEQDKDPITIVLVLDSSPSTELRFKTMKEQASKFVDDLPTNINVMVVDFNSELKVRSQPTTDRAAAQAAISKVKVGGGTSLYSAMKLLYEKLLPPIAGRKVLVLMTDGVDTMSRTSFAESIAAVEKEAITVYPVYFDTYGDRLGARNNSNDWIAQILRQTNPNLNIKGSSEAEYRKGLLYLNDLAAATGGRAFSSEKLAEGTKSLLGELANRYYVTLTVPRSNSGSRTIRVRVNRPSLAVFARSSFRY
jgi:VWFA-related protein